MTGWRAVHAVMLGASGGTIPDEAGVARPGVHAEELVVGAVYARDFIKDGYVRTSRRRLISLPEAGGGIGSYEPLDGHFKGGRIGITPDRFARWAHRRAD